MCVILRNLPKKKGGAEPIKEFNKSLHKVSSRKYCEAGRTGVHLQGQHLGSESRKSGFSYKASPYTQGKSSLGQLFLNYMARSKENQSDHSLPGL